VFNVAEQFTSKSQVGLEAWKSVVNASFDGMGKLAALNLHTARAVAKQGAENFKALSEVRDMAGLKALQKPMAIAAVSQSVAFSRRAYHISNESSSAVVQILGSQLSQAGRGVVGVLQEAKKNTPPGVDFAVSSGKTMLSSVASMLANLAQFTKPASEVSAEPVVKLIAKTA
jgi:phasin family protein